MFMEIPVSAINLLERTGGSDMQALKDVCPDPRQLFVLSPTLLRVAELAQLYAEDVSDIIGLMRTFKRRMSDERWNEERSAFQIARFEKKKDAIADLEATTIAVMAVDFRTRRLNDMMERWGNLATYVEEQLLRCATGERQFGPDLRDACRELREMETALDELLPHTSGSSRASQMMSQSREKREDLIIAIEGGLRSIAGADASRGVLRLIRDGGASNE